MQIEMKFNNDGEWQEVTQELFFVYVEGDIIAAKTAWINPADYITRQKYNTKEQALQILKSKKILETALTTFRLKEVC